MISKAVLSMMENPTEEKIQELENLVEKKARGAALTKLRNHLGVSQEVFAGILGISEEELEDLELNGIDADMLQKIQETYGS
jgi:DNA-binding transcriptional regulator YiaG